MDYGECSGRTRPAPIAPEIEYTSTIDAILHERTLTEEFYNIESTSAAAAGPLLLVHPIEAVRYCVARADGGPVPEGGLAPVLLAAGAAEARLEATGGGDHRVGVTQTRGDEEGRERLDGVLGKGTGGDAGAPSVAGLKQRPSERSSRRTANLLATPAMKMALGELEDGDDDFGPDDGDRPAGVGSELGSDRRGEVGCALEKVKGLPARP